MPLQLPYFAHDYALKSPEAGDPYFATYKDVMTIPSHLPLRSDPYLCSLR